ncbi:MAG: polysaccharide deacetylase family protein [Deltaproteobacteria bacterium]|nr:polysaccharide deacetylase family protein [Deltaproteobacteria bacterium]
MAEPALRAAVNVDIDGLYLYDRIHGHAGGAGNAAGFDAVAHDPRAWTRGVPRFLDLFARAGVHGSFFAVAQDLDHPDVRAVLRDVVAAGHEIGSHSLTHPYDLSRLPPADQREELHQARARLQDATGQGIAGFRAPGYVLSATLLATIAEVGHTWDSSRFPCPPYQLAKAAAIGLYRATGRPSGSIPEQPGVWVGRRTPYRESLQDGRSLVELPIGVLPGVRWPVIGTAVIVAGELGRLALQPILDRTDWINFELHAIDLLDHAGDELPDRLLAQPDQRVPLRNKWKVLLRMLERLAATHNVRTLGGWAETE